VVVQLVLIVDGDVTERDPGALEELLGREDGVIWVDMVAGSEETRTVLSDVFGARPSAVRECEHPGLVPRVRRYADHVLIELHAPANGPDGLVDGVAIDTFAGRRYVVTVHERREGISQEDAMRDTATVLRRVREGRAKAGSAAQLAHAVATAVVDNMESRVRELSDRVVKLEREIMHGRAVRTRIISRVCSWHVTSP
jgi:Mg2+ and Co2+ transporter CorA